MTYLTSGKLYANNTIPFRLILGAMVLLMLTMPVAAEEYYADYEHTGRIQLENGLSIFPENRKNNAVYDRDGYVFSSRNNTVLTAFKDTGLILYASRNEFEGTNLNYFLLDDALTPIRDGNTILVDRIDEDRKVYFLNDGQRVESFSVKYRTGAGFTFNDNAVVFFHIKGLFKDDKPNAKPYYSININYLNLQNNTYKILKKNVQNGTARIALKWDTDDNVVYTLQNGQTETLIVE